MIAAALATQIKALRKQADLRSVPSGLLAWWGNTDFPDGERPVPTLAQSDWESLYTRLEFAALDALAMPPLYAVKALTLPMRPDAAVPLAIADFSFARPQPAFVQRVMRAAEEGVALDAPTQGLASVIEDGHAFAACALLHDQWGRQVPQYRGRSVSFVLDPRFYFTNAGQARPNDIEIDPGDGSGWHQLAFGDTLSASYPTGDAAVVTLRCSRGGAVRSTRFSLALSDQPAAPPPDDTWALRGTTSNTGTAFVYRAAGRAELEHPLIVAEGFPGGYANDYLYDMLNQHGLFESWRAAGYDPIVVGFDNGMDLMQNNAQIVEACVREAMRRTGNALVVGGVSMGGLVSRYALADMETRGVPHNTRIYFSIDSPHGGTNTSPCDQWLAQHMRSSSALAASVCATLDSPANQQFVKAWVHEGVAEPSPMRLQWLADLDKVGRYPQLPRRLAVACGRGDGQRSIAAGQLALEWSGSHFAHAKLWALPERGASQLVAQGYSLLADPGWPATLSVRSDVSWEGAPGGQNVYNLVAAAIAKGMGCGQVDVPVSLTCCVPTVSALDLNADPFEPVPPPGSGASPFHDYVCCDENQMHVQFTRPVKDWLLERVGPPSAVTTNLDNKS